MKNRFYLLVLWEIAFLTLVKPSISVAATQIKADCHCENPAAVIIKDGGLKVYTLEDHCETSDMMPTDFLFANDSTISPSFILDSGYVAFRLGGQEYFVSTKHVKNLKNVPRKIFAIRGKQWQVVSIQSGGAKIYKRTNGKIVPVENILLASGSLISTGSGIYLDTDTNGMYQYHNFRRLSSFTYKGIEYYIADSVLQDVN